MTLFELTVVILVLISLIAILFVGARAWKRGSDRSANLLNIRHIQQAVRSHQNLERMDQGANLEASTIMSTDGATGYLRIPIPPSDLAPYTYSGTVPALGQLYVTNHFDHPIYGFKSDADFSGW